MRQVIPWIAACIACAGLAVALHSVHKQTREAARLREQLSATNMNASREIVHLEKELADLRVLLASSRRALAQSQKAGAKANAPGQVDLDAMRNDPAFAEAWRRNQMRWDQWWHGGAIAALKLQPEKLARLRNLLVDRSAAMLDAGEAAKEQGLDPREANQAATQAMGDVDNEIKQLLGADAYAQFQQDNQADYYRPTLSTGLASDLAINGTPLSQDQLDAMARLYADSTNPAKNPNMTSPAANTPDPTTGLTARSQWILAGASSLLTPEQLQAMRQSLLLDQQRQQFYQEQNKASGKGP